MWLTLCTGTQWGELVQAKIRRTAVWPGPMRLPRCGHIPQPRHALSGKINVGRLAVGLWPGFHHAAKRPNWAGPVTVATGQLPWQLLAEFRMQGGVQILWGSDSSVATLHYWSWYPLSPTHTLRPGTGTQQWQGNPDNWKLLSMQTSLYT